VSTFFISDLHISDTHPEIGARFSEFCESMDQDVDALYILGDLYEYWIGDDAADALGHRPSINQLARLRDRGIELFFMHGNRDFLIGPQFADQTGCTLLSDPTVTELYGRRVLLTHGDSLCIDDEAHQQWRRTYLDDTWRDSILALSIAERQAKARQIRSQSITGNAQKPPAIMDVNQSAVENALRNADTDIMIHGHTHRPAIHRHIVGEAVAKRIVLGDWYSQSSSLRVDAQSMRLEPGDIVLANW